MQRGGAARFDELVAAEVRRLERRLPQVVSRVEFAVSDVPPIGPSDTEVPLTRCEGGGADQPYRIIVFRRPIQLRAGSDADDLGWLVRDCLVSELAEVLGLAPEAIDPERADED